MSVVCVFKCALVCVGVVECLVCVRRDSSVCHCVESRLCVCRVCARCVVCCECVCVCCVGGRVCVCMGPRAHFHMSLLVFGMELVLVSVRYCLRVFCFG